jgi:hypothetical protein
MSKMLLWAYLLFLLFSLFFVMWILPDVQAMTQFSNFELNSINTEIEDTTNDAQI